MTAQFARASYQSRPGGPIQHNPQAALLIDFDNVTMGIRSDLSKELKNLLGSDIIKGKVAVQRAYADWRRYPQYIVPLAEASVDLIFAPAYGSSKKNATDIRLAIDALELVFTRPEIGTYILLSGDSDFSSLVLKLKEYGKYVIGVGIRESASDLLVQNCDEYYSYSVLTGLTKTTDEQPVASNDPWELVDLAVRQMTDNEDVMRSDRLKQVLLELDPNFDEKTLGFSKFNRFLHEAANRGLLKLQKMENGQYEVALADAASPAAEAESRAVEEDRMDGRRGRRRGRGRREERTRPPAADAAPPASPAPEPAAEPVAEPVAEAVPADLEAAYVLLKRAVGDVSRGGVARDSDIKRRILEISPDFDESTFGFSKFSRFLRQAHEAQVVDVRKLDNGSYEVVAPGAPEPQRTESRGRDHGRDQRGRQERKPAAEAKPETVAEAAPAEVITKKGETPATPPKAPVAEVAAPPRGLGLRRGSRGRPSADAPPPLLEGQALGPVKPPVAEPARAAAGPAKATTKPAKKGSRRKRGRGRADEKADKATKPPRKTGALDVAALGLPMTGVEVMAYLAQNYKGVGQKMAESLVEAFGADRVFVALHTQPDRVKELLGAKRGEKLLELWQDDYAFRIANNTDPEKQKKATPSRTRRGGRSRRGRGRRTTEKT